MPKETTLSVQLSTKPRAVLSGSKTPGYVPTSTISPLASSSGQSTNVECANFDKSSAAPSDRKTPSNAPISITSPLASLSRSKAPTSRAQPWAKSARNSERQQEFSDALTLTFLDWHCQLDQTSLLSAQNVAS